MADFSFVDGFLRESLAIEGIHRPPTDAEVAATIEFLGLAKLSVEAVCGLQAVYAPGHPIRDRIGMNVSVGNYVAPGGGRTITLELQQICIRAGKPYSTPWRQHVAFELLHPFLDGNGRTGRAIWAWQMLKQGEDPFALGFLHRFYYQTLAESDR